MTSDSSDSRLADALASARRHASPHLLPGRTPWPSACVHGGVLALWTLLFGLAFARVGGVAGWSVGIAYVGYDTLLLALVGWQTAALMRAGPQHASGMAAAGTDAPRATLVVLIAAHNEAAVLPATLAALGAQSDPADGIVLVDDGSGDATAALLQQRYGLASPALGAIGPVGTGGAARLQWLRLPHRGKACALNAALPIVQADIVLTVDADTLLDADAIAAVRRAFAAEPMLVAATGVIVPVCGRSWQGRVLQWFQTYEYIRNFLSRFAWMRLDGLLLVSGAFAAYRRDALLAVGGFDPDCLVEDYELTHRLRRHAVLQGLAWQVRVLGDARARTDAPATVGAFLQQRRRWFGGFLQTQYRYRDMVASRRYGRVGTLMLPVKAVDTLQPLYGLAAFFLLLADIVSGRLGILAVAAGAIGIKLAIDLAFHAWSIHLYRRWAGSGHGGPGYAAGLAAALIEPFSFQLLRHTGAALGWFAFLTGRWRWEPQVRSGLQEDVAATAGPPT